MTATLRQRAAAETKCPRCGAEPMHPCRTPGGYTRFVHVDRVNQFKTDRAVAAALTRFEVLRDYDCPSCHAPAGEFCVQMPGATGTCPARLALVPEVE